MPKKGEILQNITIEKLVFSGKGLGYLPDGKVVMVGGGVIPGQIVSVRILKTRKGHIEGQMVDVIQHSPLETKLPDHFQVYGGCKWLPIKYEEQLRIKNEQVVECFSGLERDGLLKNTKWHSIVASPEIYGYRNKVEFSFGKYISNKEGIHDDFRFGFHKQGEFDRIIDCDFCVLASDSVNAIFQVVNTESRKSGLPTYDPKTARGVWRHLVVRESLATKECMVVFSLNTNDPDFDRPSFDKVWKKLVDNTAISTIVLLKNTGLADIVTGEVEVLYGDGRIQEVILGNTFEIAPKSFFQTNSKGAELLYSTAFGLLESVGKGGILLDLYAGTGTIGTIFGKEFSRVFSVEIVADASKDAKDNAQRNGYMVPNEIIQESTVDTLASLDESINFVPCNMPVEKFLSHYTHAGMKAGLLIVDPPRDGMHVSAPEKLLAFDTQEILYISCNPSTLVRDLKPILDSCKYEIADIVPVDMFPHTHHIETVVRLRKKVSNEI